MTINFQSLFLHKIEWSLYKMKWKVNLANKIFQHIQTILLSRGNNPQIFSQETLNDLIRGLTFVKDKVEFLASRLNGKHLLKSMS